MTDNEFKLLLISWSNFVKQYRIYFPKNSVMFPDAILIDYLVSHYPGQYTKNSNIGRKRSPYDLKDSNGNKNVEVKSSFEFKKCVFSKHQNQCDRIIYVCLESNSVSFFEIPKEKVRDINNAISSSKSSLGFYFRDVCKTLVPFEQIKF